MYKPSVFVALLVILPSTLWAQTSAPGPVIFSGAMLSYANDSVTLKDQDGKEVTVAMASDWTAIRPVRRHNDAINKGDFIASAYTPIDDRSGKSIELRIMEPGYKPEGGGGPPESPTPPQAHGTVKSLSRTAAGIELDITDRGSAQHLIVPNNAEVTVYELMTRAELKAGAKIEIKARKSADGVLRATRLTLAP